MITARRATVVFALAISFVLADGVASADDWGWHIDTIDDHMPRDITLAFDQSSNPHIVYWVYGDGIKYAHNNASYWIVENISTHNIYEGSMRMALDSNGFPYIVYTDNNEVHYLYFDGSQWSHELIDSKSGNSTYKSICDIAIDANNGTHIAYSFKLSDSEEIRYAYKSDNEWIIEIIDENIEISDFLENEMSIDIDSADNPHIVYHDVSLGFHKERLKYAKKGVSGWEIDIVEEGKGSGFGCSMVLDQNGSPHIAYDPYGPISYAYYSDSSWHFEEIFAFSGWGTSIAVSKKGVTHVGTVMNGADSICYAIRINGNWEFDYISGADCYPSLALDQKDKVHFAFNSYADPYNPVLGYAYRINIPIDDDDNNPSTPITFSLSSAYPNPSSGAATIAFALPQPCDVNLDMFDIKGRKVATLAKGEYAAGEYETEVNNLSSGIYLYRLRAGEFSDTKKMVVR